MALQLSSQFNRETVEKVLADQDDIEGVIGSLQLIGRTSISNDRAAGPLNCADVVAAATRRPESKVVAAAMECLGQLGSEGAQFKDEVVAGLRHNDEHVRLAAAQSLGQFGKSASGSAAELARLLDDKHDDVKAAAINALGLVKATGQADAIAKNLDDKNLTVVSASCLALGNLGQAAHGNAGAIVKKFDDASLRFSALSALVQMGSSVTCEHVDVIIAKCLVDKDYWCRQAAVAAISQNGDSLTDKQVDKLVALLKHDEPGVRCAVCFALGGSEKGKAHVEAIAALLKSDDGEDKSNLAVRMGGSHRVPAQFRKVRVAALSAIGLMKAGNFAAECADHFSDKSWEVRLQALESVGMLGEDGGAISNHVAELLDDEVYIVRAKACEVLGALKADHHTEKLVELFQDKCPSVRVTAVYAVGQMGEEAIRHSTAVFKMTNDFVTQVRAAACSALGEMGEAGQSYAGVIAKLLIEQTPEPELRIAAMEALGKLGAHGAAFTDEIALCLQDTTPEVREVATKTLEQMSGEVRHGEEE